MALPKQLADVPFQTGVDQKADPRLIQLGAHTTVENGVLTKGGAIRKRWGYTSLGQAAFPSGTVSAGKWLLSYGDTLGVIDGASLYAYSSGASKFSLLDKVPEPIARWSSIGQSGKSAIALDCTTNGTYLVYAWVAVNSTGVCTALVSVFDLSTGAALYRNYQLPPLAATAITAIRCAIQGTTLAVAYSSGTTIYARSLDLGTPGAWSAEATLTAIGYDTGSTAKFDFVPNEGGSNFVLAFPAAAPSNCLRVDLISTALASTANTTVPVPGGYANPYHAIAVKCTSGETLWVGYAISNGVATESFRLVGLNPATLAATVTDTELYQGTLSSHRVGVARISSTVACLVGSESSGNITRWRQFNTSAATVGATRLNYGSQLLCRPMQQGGKTFSVLWLTQDGHNVLVDLATEDTTNSPAGRPVATIGPYLATTNVSFPNVVGAVASGTTWYTGVNLSQSASRAGVYRTELDFGTSLRWQLAELGGLAYLSGGTPSVYDGTRVYEHGFFATPTATIVGSGVGGSIAAGTYQYAIVYAWYDAKGNVHRGRVFLSPTVTLAGATSSVAVTNIPYLHTTSRQDPEQNEPRVVVEIYRTLANGSTFYKISSDDVPTAWMNDPTTNTFTYTDTLIDASISTNPILYTTGADGTPVMGSVPPSLDTLISHNGRLWGVAGDGVTLWYSTQSVSGEAVRWSPSFTLELSEGGRITALGSMDGTLVIFKRDRIYTLDGSGPNEQNTASDLGDPRRLPTDAGCIDPRSVVSCPLGLFFQSSRGLYLLTRAREVQYQGKAVEDTLAANPVVTSATVFAPSNEIRFTCRVSETSSTGVVLVYNYLFDAWTVWKLKDQSGAGTTSVAVPCGVTLRDRWYWTCASGYTYRENNDSTATNAYTDAGAWVTLTVESAWFKPTGIGGWARTWHMMPTMEILSPHDLTLSVGTDYSSSYAQSSSFTGLAISGWVTPLELASLHIGQQKATAYRFKISDGTPTGIASTTGAGPNLIGITVEYGAYQGGYRLPPSQGA